MMIMLIVGVATYGLVVCSNLIRKIMCLTIIEGTIILTFLTTGFHDASVAPILPPKGLSGDTPVDPIPQALMLTAIVVGVCFKSLALVFLVRLHQQTGTLEVGQLNER